MGAPRPLHHSKKLLDVLADDPPVPEGAQLGRSLLVPPLEESGWRRPEDREKALDRRPDRRDAPEREGRGEERDDLAVASALEAVGEEERVGVEAAPAPLGPEGVEPRAEAGEVGAAGPRHRRYASIPDA